MTHERPFKRITTPISFFDKRMYIRTKITLTSLSSIVNDEFITELFNDEDTENLEHYLFSLSKEDRLLYAKSLFDKIIMRYCHIRAEARNYSEGSHEKYLLRKLISLFTVTLTSLVVMMATRLEIPFEPIFIKKYVDRGFDDPIVELMTFYCAPSFNSDKADINKLPGVLNDTEISNIFEKAIQCGIITIDGSFFKWNETKQLLAYFCEKISLKFNLSNKFDKDGEKTINWKIFETVFNIKNIKYAKNDWMKINVHFTPTGYEKIRSLIE